MQHCLPTKVVSVLSKTQTLDFCLCPILVKDLHLTIDVFPMLGDKQLFNGTFHALEFFLMAADLPVKGQ